MRINAINIPKDFMGKGLEAVNLNRLGEVVVIAGKNGAGKSRLLNIINDIEKYFVNQGGLKQVEWSIQDIKVKMENEQKKPQPNNAVINNYKIQLSENILKRDVPIFFKIDNALGSYKSVKFVPNRLDLSPSSDSQQQMKEFYNQTNNISLIHNLSTTVLSYIRYVCERNFEAKHIDSSNEVLNVKWRNSFNALDELIFAFLGTRLLTEFNEENGRNYKLFSLDIDNMNLSDGQKVLLQLCVMMHSQGASLENMVLILDEPENHLQPCRAN